MTPSQLTLTAIQDAFRDITRRMDRFDGSNNIDMKSRRIINAGKAQGPFDYVRKTDMETALAGIEAQIADPQSPTALNLGVIKAVAPLTANAILLGAGLNKATVLGSLGTTVTVLHGNAGGAPTFTAVVLTTDVSGVLPVANGGTALASYTTGDLLYASGAGTLAKLADAATGNALLAGGAGVAPAYGKVDLTATVTGTLPVANGGTAVTYDRIAASVALTNQTATIGPTTIASAGTQFLFTFTLLDTTADLAAGAVQLTVNYTDDAGAAVQTSGSLALTAVGRTSGVWSIQRASGNVTYTVTLTGLIGSAKYAIYATLIRLS